MDTINRQEINNSNIRYQLDLKSNEFFYSIVDIIDQLGLSTDARNYWKVLKNRLKKGHPELVTSCNQLKMLSSDGKLYLTDVANSRIILQIIQLISPNKVSKFTNFFDKTEANIQEENLHTAVEEKKISTDFFDDGEIQIDMLKAPDHLLIKAMIAGVLPQDIFISVSSKNLLIKSNRIRQSFNFDNQENILDGNFFLQELYWGKFKREIELPEEVDIDKIEATSYQGLLTVKLFFLDKNKTKIIKVRNI
jgi:HSP20 family molecular chaperone IbpA